MRTLKFERVECATVVRRTHRNLYPCKFIRTAGTIADVDHAATAVADCNCGRTLGREGLP